jgi:hypothetical protein
LNPFDIARNLLKTLLPDPEVDAFKSAMGLIRQRSHDRLAELGQITDSALAESELWSVIVMRQIAALFKKNSTFADDDVCTLNAQKTFERGERKCRITNKRLDWYYFHEDRLDPELKVLLTKMQRDIASLLGDTEIFIDAMPRLIKLTNGATEDRPRRRSYPFLKISGKLRGPRAAIPYIGRLLQEFGVDLSSCVYTCVEQNAITLVPKNWKTHRTIAKEPTHSLPFQLALDGWLKRLLRKWKIDLSSQAKNQELARVGSLQGTFATIDLEMASDTLSLNAVALLLPPDWFKLLSSFRSASFMAPWGFGDYAKFTSMGNGYTFSLETMIFTAACRACGSREYAVYGDDIVIETEYVPSLVKLLSFLGFNTNKEKSFVNRDSRFRESCGCDYYKGELITPFYLRECPKETDYSGVSHVLNGLVACTAVPGPMWDWVAATARRLRLRLVPWNEDSRSGVFITPHSAWKTRKLEVDRRIYPKKDNPNFGFPVYKGYQPTQDRRKTVGRRSLFYWFLKKKQPTDLSDFTPKRTSARLLQANANGGEGCEFGTATVTSFVNVRTRYVHSTRRFDPKPTATPSYLFLWDEVVLGQGARRNTG